MPIDFLSDDMNISQQTGQSSGRDFLMEEFKPKESFGISAALAIPRVGTDIAKGLYHFAQEIPGYYEKSKTEIPGAINLLMHNPRRAGSQALAGIAESGQNVFNTPHDIINYLSQRLNLVPEDINKMVQMGRMPSDTEQIINQQFGSPQQPGESLIRGINRDLNYVLPVSNALVSPVKLAINATRRIDKRKVANSIQLNHDKLLGSAVNDFNNVGKEAVRRNINTIPIRQNLISDIENHSLIPKTKKMQDILSKANSGDYEALRDLQSELFHRGNMAGKSILQSEKLAGETLHDLRDEVNNSITNHFQNTGNMDLANQLNNGRKKYKLLQDTYFGKQTPVSIKKLVGKSRKMPKNIMGVLSEESLPMEAIKKENPFAVKKSLQYESKKNAIKRLKQLGYAATIGSLGLSGIITAPIVYNKIFEND